jgi:hypothetical protein
MIPQFWSHQREGRLPNISEIMRKPILYIYSTFRNFTLIACMFLQIITFRGFYTL